MLLASVGVATTAMLSPGVIIGGQIGPELQVKVPQQLMIRAIGVLFGIIGLAMLRLVLG